MPSNCGALGGFEALVVIVLLAVGGALFREGCDSNLKPWCRENRQAYVKVAVAELTPSYVTACSEWIVMPGIVCQSPPCYACNATAVVPFTNNIVRFRRVDKNGENGDGDWDVNSTGNGTGNGNDPDCFLIVDDPEDLNQFRPPYIQGPFHVWPGGSVSINGTRKPKCVLEPSTWDVRWARIGFGLMIMTIPIAVMNIVLWNTLEVMPQV
jgi:hypothetical protein